MGKRYKNLYSEIGTFENIWLASRKARRGKRQRPDVIEFEYNLEQQLFSICHDLLHGTYQFQPYHIFIVREPNTRLISAAPYRDRVTHHAICNIIEPILDQMMIYDSYACRTGKGMHRALDRAQQFLNRWEWVLKLDIRKYFFSIDHQVLLQDLSAKLADPRLLILLKQILDTYNSGETYYLSFSRDLPIDRYRARGLPIGNLTSQLFANFYLTRFDRFIKENLKVKGYVRYMDDCLLFAETKSELCNYLTEITDFLAHLRLHVHDQKTQVFPQKNGIRFLGFHLYRDYRRILPANLKRFKRKFKSKIHRFEMKEAEMDYLLRSLNAWLGFAGRNENYTLIKDILHSMAIQHPYNDYTFKFAL